MAQITDKAVKAKLYNLKSYIEGKIQEIDAQLCEPEKTLKGLMIMVDRADQDLRKQSENQL